MAQSNISSPLLCALSLRDIRCLVVGAGNVGQRRTRTLLQHGAHVTLIDPRNIPSSFLTSLPPDHHKRLTHHTRTYQPSDTHNIDLCVACTHDPTLNNTILQNALQTTPLTSSATPSPHTSLTFCASHLNGPITLAVHSGSASPLLSKHLTTHIAQSLSPLWTQAALHARTLRPILPSILPTQPQRAQFWSSWLSPPLFDALRSPHSLLQHTLSSLPTPPNPATTTTLQHALSPPHTNARRTLLLSSFGPFPGVPVNPSRIAAEHTQTQLLKHLDTHSLDDVVHVNLPTHFDEAWTLLLNAIQTVQNDPTRTLSGVVSLGVSGKIDRVHLERTAVNIRAAHKPDASGRSFDTPEPLVGFAPQGLLSSLCVDQTASTVRSLGHKIDVSEHAGTYLCNEVFYKLLLWRNQHNVSIPAGFIHIPPAHTSPPEDTAHVLRAALTTLFPPPTPSPS